MSLKKYLGFVVFVALAISIGYFSMLACQCHTGCKCDDEPACPCDD